VRPIEYYYFARRGVQDILQNFIYVGNASLAQSCYEQRLIHEAPQILM